MKTLEQVAYDAYWVDSNAIPYDKLNYVTKKEWERMINAIIEEAIKQGIVKAMTAEEKNQIEHYRGYTRPKGVSFR